MKTCRVCQRSYSAHFANCPQDGTPLFESEEWAEGTVVRGKYQIIQKIGQGAMGAVYKALHMHFEELRALKVIASGLSSDKAFVKRFEQEAILTRKLQHPNAVRVDDIDATEDGQPFIVMEYIEGKNLRKVIQNDGPMEAARVSAIIQQVASALDAAHKLGIVHRDIKPENIVLIQSKKEEVAKVLDFGIAKLKEGLSGTTATSMTDTGMVVGTPPYMSPEQAMASPGNELDGRSDIYSLGIVMYQMLTDELPIKGETALQIVLAHIQNPPIPIQVARAGVKIPQPLAELVMMCLAKDRNDRPATGQQMIDALKKWEASRHDTEEGATMSMDAADLAVTVALAHKAPVKKAAEGSSGGASAASQPAKTVKMPTAVPVAASGAAQAQAAPRTKLGWLPAIVVIAALAAVGAWMYRDALMGLVERKGSAAASNMAERKPAAAVPSNSLPDNAAEKPIAPGANSSAAADAAPVPPATPAVKAIAPPDALKTKDYTEVAARKESRVSGSAAEHEGFRAVQAVKDEAHQIQKLDDFVARFPNSELLPDAFALYYRDYRELRNFPKVMEYADKLVALGDKVDANTRFQALYARAIAYDALRPSDPEQARHAKDAAAVGLSTLNAIQKPPNVSEASFAAERKPLMVYFDVTGGMAAMTMKDYPAAIDSYRAALALDPEDGNASYQLGLAYLAVNPARQPDGLWALAHAATAKGKGGPPATEIKTYLKKVMLSYEQTQCPSLVDPQAAELVQAAAGNWERPESYKLPSKADLDAERNAMSIVSVVADLKTDPDKAKSTWLAACGLEFPNVPGKVISVAQGDPVVLKVALVSTELEFRAARRANMEVTLPGQPEAGGLAVGSLVRFTGTLSDFDRTPLMLRWQKAKINPKDLPKTNETPAPAQSPQTPPQ
jgi:eukaryotic-like serine/threonine-protein kinase